MNRRLYFLFPDRVHALSAINELAANGIPEDNMHVLADKAIPLDGLPNATYRQKYDDACRLEKLLWSANPVLLFGLSLWLLVCIGLMVSTFHAGLRFTHVPNTTWTNFRMPWPMAKSCLW